MKTVNDLVESGDKGRIAKIVFFVGLGGSLVLIFALSLVFWQFSRGLPDLIQVSDYRPATVTRVMADNGNADLVEVGEFYKQRRYIIPYETIPKIVVQAFVAAEDDRFFEHSGVNLVSILRAGIANFRAGHVVQGGSTITQQVAKSLLLTPEKSLDRKIKELILAYRIERNLTKQQILYLYLNEIYLGHGAYGVQAASRTFFRKNVAEISIAEAALIAGMPTAPGKFSPLLNPRKAKERQLYVLRRMFENHYISREEMSEAASEPLKIYGNENINNNFEPYLVEHIRRYLIEKYGEKAVYEDGLTVTLPTSMDSLSTATNKLKEGLRDIDKRLGYRGPLKHLRNSEEIENYLKDLRRRLVSQKLRFQTLLPEGRLGIFESLKLAHYENEAALLDPGEVYEGVITEFDSKKKLVHVMIGAVRADMPYDKTSWATNGKIPQTTLRTGDVIMVSLVSNLEKNPQVQLEQLPAVQGALISMDVRTGYVLSMVGGYDFEQSEFNRVTQASRQIGSAFKPVIYAAALEKGFTPASVIVDSPIVFRDTTGEGSWKPNNFEEKFYGDTTFRQALIKSRNIPTIKIVQSIQVPYLIGYARRLGLTATFNPDLSISLGSGTSTLLELSKVYALFPRLGRKVDPIFFTKILDRDGRVLEERIPVAMPAVEQILAKVGAITTPASETAQSSAPNAKQAVASPVGFQAYPLADDLDQVMDPRIAYVMTHLMKEVVTFGTGHRARDLGRIAAGKTGTTNDAMDAWFIGFTPRILTGVWVGYDNLKSLGAGETGARVALPIWLNYMKDAVKKYQEEDFNIPPGINFVSINANTGKPAASNSAGAIKEAFIEGTEPTGTAGESESSDSQTDFFKEDRE